MKSAATLVSLILLLHHVHAQDANLTDRYAFCGDCWCIPDDGETCPYDDMPPTEFSDTLIQNLKGMTHENPLALDCDPFYDTGCDTVPALETGDVCGALVKANGDQCPQDFSYTLQTFASSEDAEANGFTVTHEGACGVCSSFQDLTVYMALPDLADLGVGCTLRAMVDIEDGILCYQEIGFSPSCGALWLYNSNNTKSLCLTPCLAHASSGEPNNEPAPGCELVECIQCDEDNSGPIFQQFGGRSRRRSALLSTIARPCSSIPTVQYEDPCLAPEEDTSSEGDSSGGASDVASGGASDSKSGGASSVTLTNMASSMMVAVLGGCVALYTTLSL